MKKKLLLSVSLVLSLSAGEIQYGSGNFQMSGGVFGVNQELDIDLTTYSIIQNHQNILSSNVYYKYNFTWYDSKTITAVQDSLNSYSTTATSFIPTTTTYTPTMDYRMQGLDVNVVLGYDVYHKNENNFLGLGIMIGVSTPWIDSKDSSSDDSDYPDDTLLKESKTEIITYKVGPSISLMQSFNKHLMIYASATYAYQTGSIKNSYMNSSFQADGTFQEYDIGLKLQPLSEEIEIGWFTLSPRLYFTAGYRYSDWQLDDIDTKALGVTLPTPSTDFNMNSSITYLGFGYTFF